MPSMTWTDIQTSKLSEKDKQYMVMYGCTQDDLGQMMANPINRMGGIYMLTLSILSDAQEAMAHGDNETARQFINRAKYVIRLNRKELFDA